MLKDLLGDIFSFIKARTFILGVLFVFLLGVLVHRLFVLQIVNGEEYYDSFIYRIQKDVEIESARGTIYDCNGVALAYNELSYSVTIEDSTLLTDNQTKNTMIALLIEYIESTGNEVIYDMPIEMDDDGNLVFSAGENTVLRFKKDIYSSETLTDEQTEATAQEVYEYMRSSKLFNLDESYEIEEALKILSIRYDLYMKRYEKYQSVTVATDVNDELVAAVKENTENLPGVSIEQDYTRVYANSKYFSNIIGYIGAISEDELDAYEEAGDDSYSQNDMVGKTGIEAYFESTLKGEKGSQTLYVNSLGSILEIADTVEATPGQDIYLTIDADLQMTVYDMLEERIAGILLAYMTDTVDSENSNQQIPIKDFYYALIDNNVIDLDHLSAETATDEEQSFWQKYETYRTSVFNTLEEQMSTVRKDLSKEYRSYISMACSMLEEDGILDTSVLDDNDETVSAWSSGTISCEEYILYAITNAAIDISPLELDEDYLDSNDIYSALLSYITDNLPYDEDFEKEAYYYMLENDYISGRDICLLLYAQGVLEEDDDYTALKDGTLSAYTFMYKKIYNLEITPDMLALAPCSGSFVMTDVDTGEVLALVSYPGYDANQINNVSYFSSLVNNASSPFYNRATQQTIAPGSTFKPLVAIAALEEGIITADTYITDKVEFTKIEPSAYCWNRSGHGTVNVTDALMYSCNYFFYEVGYKMATSNGTSEYSDSAGLSIISKYASMFGLDSITGLELTESTPKVSDEDAVRSAIGQGTHNYTAAQLTRYVATIANSGSLYELTILDKITESDGTVIEENEPTLISKLDIADSTWEAVQTGMYKVCNVSSYRSVMSGLDITLAGKSGTAQESESLPNHSLFVGYAPYEDPEVAATIIIPNGYGSAKILDLYADIMCYYFGVLTDSDTTTRTANIPDVSFEAD